MQPKLLNKLREGMERLSVAPTERDTFIARLVYTHGHTSTGDGQADGVTQAIPKARWRPDQA